MYMESALRHNLPDWRLHDLRRTAASEMAGLDQSGIIETDAQPRLRHQLGSRAGLIRGMSSRKPEKQLPSAKDARCHRKALPPPGTRATVTEDAAIREGCR